MKRRRQLAIDHPDWIDGDLYLHVNTRPVVIRQGSRQRGLPCIACNTPAGGQKCYLLCLVAGVLCPADNSHLNGIGLFCHVRCLPPDDRRLYEVVVHAVTQLSH